jgi:integrase/recombinase XerD
MEACMAVNVVRLTRSRNAAGELVVRLGVRLLDEYLEFLSGRCRPNTVLAVAYDLKVFFTVVGKPPRRVRSVDVLAFMTAQRTGGEGRLQVAGEEPANGVSARTLRRRLSSVSGLYGFLLVRGDVSVNPVPRGLPTRRERQRPGQGVPLVRVPRMLPRILDPAEVDALTAALRTHRDRAMVAAMVLGGLRRCEVLALRLADLRFGERRLFIAEGKGGHQRLVPVSSRFFTEVSAYPRRRAPRRDEHGPGVRGPEGPAPRPAAVSGGTGRDPRQRPGPGRAGTGDVSSAAAYLPDPAAEGRHGFGGGAGPGRSCLDRVHPHLPAPG